MNGSQETFRILCRAPASWLDFSQIQFLAVVWSNLVICCFAGVSTRCITDAVTVIPSKDLL